MHYFHLVLQRPFLLDAIVLEVPRGKTVGQVLELAYKNESRSFQQADVVLVRPPVHVPISSEIFRKTFDGSGGSQLPLGLRFLGVKKKDIKPALRRADDRPVYILYSEDFSIKISVNLNIEAKTDYIKTSKTKEDAIRLIQRAEFDMLIDKGRGILPEIPGFVYRAPSGFGQRAFLRVGNIQSSRAAIDAVFFWLLPFLSKCRGVVAETWSIGSIAMNVSRRLVVYRKDRRPCPVEMMSDYLKGSDASLTEAADTVEHLLNLSTEGGRFDAEVIFIQSAVSTGTLHTRLTSSLLKRNIDLARVKFVALFNVGATSQSFPCLRDFSGDRDPSPFTPFEIKNTPAENQIDIDAHTYFVSQYRDVEKTITTAQVSEADAFIKSFMRNAKGSLFRVHKTVVDGSGRHHAIWIDTVSLIKRKKFTESFERLVFETLPLPGLILSPGHTAANHLAKAAAAILRTKSGLDVPVYHHPDLDLDSDLSQDRVIEDAINKLSNSVSILILDDCLITGTRLRTYQRNMRRLNFDGPVHYVVGVARPESSSIWKKTVRMLTFPKNKVKCVTQLLLPDYDETKCPWCSEQDLYQRLIETQPVNTVPPLVIDRKKMLEISTIDGLSDSLFLHPEYGKQLDFQRKSLFATKTSAEVTLYASVASSIQWLRNQDAQFAPLGPRHYPISTVFNCDDYLRETFNESRLRACIIRALRTYEMVYTDKAREEHKTENATEIFLSEEARQNELILELMLAHLQGKLPMCNTVLLQSALNQAGLSESFGLLLKVANEIRSEEH